jgi:hypothetical protein
MTGLPKYLRPNGVGRGLYLLRGIIIIDNKHTPPFSAEFKNKWVYTYTPLYAFMVYNREL